jgi:Uma2 family endonuclease
MYVSQPDEPLRMTEAEYLAFEDSSEIKHEWRAGRVYAMTGASVRHNTIIASIILHLGNQLMDRDCTINAADTRVHIASNGTYRYPDVTVFCGEPALLAGRADTITNPILLIEVISPGSALRDYNEKLEEHTQIASLDAYVLVSQDEPKVAVFRRHETDRWLYEYATGLDAAIGVPVAGTELHLVLAQVYRRVTFDQPDDETGA